MQAESSLRWLFAALVATLGVAFAVSGCASGLDGANAAGLTGDGLTPQQPTAISVQIDTNSGHILVPVTLNGQDGFWAMLDTGNEGTVLFRRVADRLGLTTQPLGEMQGLGAGAIQVESAGPLEVAIAGENASPVAFTDQTVTVLPDAAALPPIDGKQVDVFLGASFIAQHALTIDYRSNVLTITDANHYQAPTDASVMPLGFKDGFPFVRGSVTPAVGPAAGNPIQGAFLIDLGAAFGVQLDYAPAAAAGLLHPELPGREVVGLLAGITGEPMELITVPASRVEIGGVDLPNNRVVVLPVESGGPMITDLIGTVGADLFRSGSITLDYQRQRLLMH